MPCFPIQTMYSAVQIFLCYLFIEHVNLCKSSQIEATSGEETIVGSMPAGDFNSQAECSLELTDLPFHSAVELIINSYVLPPGCECDQDGTSRCNHITVTISAFTKKFCSPSTADRIDIGGNDAIQIELTRRDQNPAVNFTITFTCKFN